MGNRARSKTSFFGTSSPRFGGAFFFWLGRVALSLRDFKRSVTRARADFFEVMA